MGNGKYQKTGSPKKMGRNKIIGISLTAVVCLCLFFWYGTSTNWKFTSNSAGIDDGTSVANITSSTITIQNQRGTELDDAHSYYYGYHLPDNYTEESLKALTLTDYTYEASRASGKIYEYEEDHIYIVEINCTNYQTIQILVTASVLTVKLCATPTTTNAVAISEKLDTTINETTEVDWTLVIRFTDAQGQINDTMGYKPFKNYTQMKQQYQVLVFDCNSTTIEEDDVEVSGVAVVRTTVVNDKICVEINEQFIGEKEITIEFDSDMGTDFKVNQVLYAFGTASAYITLATIA